MDRDAIDEIVRRARRTLHGLRQQWQIRDTHPQDDDILDQRTAVALHQVDTLIRRLSDSVDVEDDSLWEDDEYDYDRSTF